jgi:hypothetical protein
MLRWHGSVVLSILSATLRRLRRWKALWASFGPLFIGFLAGVIAKFLHPGPNEPSGFILTTVLGIVEPSSRHFWDKRSDGTKLAKALD